MKDGILQIHTNQTKPLVVRLVDDAGEPLELSAWQVYGAERTARGEVVPWPSSAIGPDTVLFSIPPSCVGGLRDCDVWIKSPAGVEACLWSGRVCRLPRVATNCPAMGEAATITATVTTKGDALEVALTADVLFSALELQEFEDKLKTATQEAGKTVEAARAVATAAAQVAGRAQEAQASADRAAEAHVAAEAARGEAEAVATEAAHTLDTSAAAHLARVEASASEGVAAVNSASTAGTEEVRAAQATGVSAVEQAAESGCVLVRDTAAELAGDTALLSRDNAFSGNNTHAGVEIYNGPVACNAPVLLDGKELRTLLADSIVAQATMSLGLNSQTLPYLRKKGLYNCSTSSAINTSANNNSMPVGSITMDDPSKIAYKTLEFSPVNNSMDIYSYRGITWRPRPEQFLAIGYNEEPRLWHEHLAAAVGGTLEPEQMPQGKLFAIYTQGLLIVYTCTGKTEIRYNNKEGFTIIAEGTDVYIWWHRQGFQIVDRYKINTQQSILYHAGWGVVRLCFVLGRFAVENTNAYAASEIAGAPLGVAADLLSQYKLFW